jgi:DNA-binding LacI/PurR family transcriptional regulator
MISQGVEGVIISPVSRDSVKLLELMEETIKVVFIDNRPDDPDIACVYVDHREAARLATEHLIEAGHRKILLLNGPAALPSSQDFQEGFIKTLLAHGITADRRLIKNNPISIERTCDQIAAIFSGKDVAGSKDFTAILTLSDVIAIGVYESATRYGFEIPATYSLVGYDNILATKYLNPPLTTVQQPKEQTGLVSINLLLDQIENGLPEHNQIILDPELIIRASVKNITPNPLR